MLTSLEQEFRVPDVGTRNSGLVLLVILFFQINFYYLTVRIENN